MGSGSSSTASSYNAPSPAKSSAELYGKKVLACPVCVSLVHPATGHRWFLLVSAPASYHGLTFAARNMTARSALLVKEYTDQDLAKEKEAQSVGMSWNVFFKAISTEIPNANENGATCTFSPLGSLTIAVKIQMSGGAAAAAMTKKAPDIFRCELMPSEYCASTLYRCFMEPIATFACKKRTDLIDRPDPVREKQFGCCEAAAVVKSAGIFQAEATVAERVAQLSALRKDVERLHLECRRATAKAALTRVVSVEATAAVKRAGDSSSLVEASPLTTPPDLQEDPLFHSDLRPIVRAAPVVVSWVEPAALGQDLPFTLMESDWETACRFYSTTVASSAPAAVASLAYYTTRRLISSSSFDLWKVQLPQFQSFLTDVVPLYPAVASSSSSSQDSPSSPSSDWFSAKRSVFILSTMLHQLCHTNFIEAANFSQENIMVLVLAALTIGLHRPRLTNDMCTASRHWLSSVYPVAPLPSHSVAVLLSLLHRHSLFGLASFIPAVVTAVAAHVDDSFADLPAAYHQQPRAVRHLRGMLHFCRHAHWVAPPEVKAHWLDAEVQYVAALRRNCEGSGVDPAVTRFPKSTASVDAQSYQRLREAQFSTQIAPALQQHLAAYPEIIKT